jgi:predicted metal-dependent phosphoesterase TrpH
MLKFARNKLVNTYVKDNETLLVHGVLDDDIYSLEINAEIKLPELVFQKVTGKWHRHTTPECPLALAYIDEAEGLRIDEEVEHQLQKGVGRKGCRHYATLLVECVKSVRETLNILGWKEAIKKNPYLSFSEFLAESQSVMPQDGTVSHVKESGSDAGEEAEDEPSAEPSPGPLKPPKNVKRPSKGFVIDLHTHSLPASACASDAVDKMIQEAMQIGLDGICLTDHNFMWNQEESDRLRQKHGFLILTGNEVTTDQGHMVAFGLDRPMGRRGIVKLEELRKAVDDADGFLIVAHPFRGFLTFGVGKLGLTVEKASRRPFFSIVDAVETLNGKVTAEENRFAAKVANYLKLPVTGGSDAHAVSEIGCYATAFEKSIQNEQELIQALKAGECNAVAFR